jgi:hypothetical protein
MGIEIREHRPGEGIDDFIEVGHEVFHRDPAWIPPLRMEIKDRLTPSKNPFFEHGDAMIFTAKKDGKLVGRCTASIDQRHLERWKDETGFFGMMDSVDDPAVTKELLAAAEDWLRRRNMKHARGPLCLNMNEEVGTLIEGFEHPPVIMTAHSRPYQAGLIEQAGYHKAKDLFSWRYDVDGASHPRADKAWKAVQEMPEVKFRSVKKRDMENELRIIMEIFNDAWSDNWGFIEATPNEVKKIAADMKLILDEGMAFIAEIDGRPMGICICLPNLNEAIYDANGKLFPLGLPKLLWRLKVKGPKWGRLIMLGIRKELRGVKKYGALSLAMYVELSKRGYERGYRWGDLSWTLEDNHPMNLGIKAMGARVYKKYRVFEKELP